MVTFLIGCKPKPEIISSHYKVNNQKFIKRTLVSNLIEPTSFVELPDGAFLISEKPGTIKRYHPTEQKVQIFANLPCLSFWEKGILSMVLDPNFDQNNWIYIFYSPQTDSLHNRISRFKCKSTGLDYASEQILLQTPTDLGGHQGGSLAFDSKGNLYISTGDDSHAGGGNQMTPGYSSMDERSMYPIFDAQRSSSNTNDFRGKILRIKPTSKGYQIPENNLFNNETDSVSNEIYIMGCRNPYRIYIDKTTDMLFWGDVGPDAGGDSERGPRGYDEINRTSQSGYFGWPLFIANNKSYNRVAPVALGSYGSNNPALPINYSPHNTGKKRLPPAQKPILYYPYGDSDLYPKLGSGGRTIMAGFVYHYSASMRYSYKLPPIFNNRFFFFDWMRNTIYTIPAYADSITNSDIEPFLPNMTFKKPVMMQTSKNGALMLLEFGSLWIGSTDGTLSVIDYHPENQKPVATIRLDNVKHTPPYTLSLSAQGSIDPDQDSLSYQWFINGELSGTDKILHYNAPIPQQYTISLIVTDPSGASSTAIQKISVGNTPPKVTITSPKNPYFYIGGPLSYKTIVSDLEDGQSISSNNIKTEMWFIPGQLPFDTARNLSEILQFYPNQIKKLDCYACHSEQSKNVGPSFKVISERYPASEQNISYLIHKVQKGGSGNWGSAIMSAHPQLNDFEAKQLVQYILSFAVPNPVSLQPEGTIDPSQLFNTPIQGNFILTGTYADKPVSNTAPNTVTSGYILRTPNIDPHNHSYAADIIVIEPTVRLLFPTSKIGFKNIRLEQVKRIEIDYWVINNGTNDAFEAWWLQKGQKHRIGSCDLIDNSKTNQIQTCSINITPVQGLGTLEIRLKQTPSVHAHVPLVQLRFALQ